MPNAPRTPARNIRVADVVWQAAQAKAATEGTTVAAVVVAALERYTGVQTPAPPPRTWRRQKISDDAVTMPPA